MLVVEMKVVIVKTIEQTTCKIPFGILIFEIEKLSILRYNKNSEVICGHG